MDCQASRYFLLYIILSNLLTCPLPFNAAQSYGLREPELIDFDGDFRISFYRGQHLNGAKNDTNVPDAPKAGTNDTNDKEEIINLTIKARNIKGSA